MSDVESLFKQANLITKKYEDHFKKPLPEQILGWWDPLNIELHPDELKKGIKNMETDINAAIASNTPIEALPDKEWDKFIF
ncbi:hypothetical protein ACEE24_06635 [Latilactobacillus curvatus]